MESWTRPNGMTIERVRVPLGVIGVIYESRPNVTADAAALCLKAGNAVILRGGSESFRSARAIHAALVEGLRAAGLPEDAIQLVPTRDRAAVGMMLAGLDGSDRRDRAARRQGSRRRACRPEARVPVFAHLEGVCHVYVDKAADLDDGEGDRAQRQDAPHRRLRRGRNAAGRSRCRARRMLKPLVAMLIDAGCEVRGDADVQKADTRAKAATEEDWPTEYLDSIIAAKVVDGVDAAIAHIERYGSHHTDAIVTADQTAADKFLERGRLARSCCTTPRRSSPTAANSASAPRSASRPAACMRAARSASSSSRRSSIASAAPARRVPRWRVIRRTIVLPPHAPGLKIGLFGGTFDPPHAAHRAACLLAMKRLGLDRIWWMVTPGNPLKDTRGLAAARRAHRGGEEARRAPAHRRHRRRGADAHPLHLRHRREARGTRCRGVQFVWIMGADNLRSFHRWQHWRGIAELVPDRGGRSRRSKPLRQRRRGRSGARPLSHPRGGRALAAPPQAARLGVPARAQIATLVHGTAGAEGRAA